MTIAHKKAPSIGPRTWVSFADICKVCLAACLGGLGSKVLQLHARRLTGLQATSGTYTHSTHTRTHTCTHTQTAQHKQGCRQYQVHTYTVHTHAHTHKHAENTAQTGLQATLGSYTHSTHMRTHINTQTTQHKQG